MYYLYLIAFGRFNNLRFILHELRWLRMTKKENIQTDFSDELLKKEVPDQMKKKALEIGEANAESLDILNRNVDLTIDSGKRS